MDDNHGGIVSAPLKISVVNRIPYQIIPLKDHTLFAGNAINYSIVKAFDDLDNDKLTVSAE